jgi:hypothetical protein
MSSCSTRSSSYELHKMPSSEQPRPRTIARLNVRISPFKRRLLGSQRLNVKRSPLPSGGRSPGLRSVSNVHDHLSSEPTRLEGSLPSTSAHLTFGGITLPTNHDGGRVSTSGLTVRESC